MANHRILIIDDDVNFIQEARTVLGSRNYNVCSNIDIDEDIDIDSIDDPDLIILRIMMCCCEKCIKLLRKFTKKLKTNKTPVIVITDTKRDRYLSREFYVDIDWNLVKNTLNKPINPSDLLNCVNFIISKQEKSTSVLE